MWKFSVQRAWIDRYTKKLRSGDHTIFKITLHKHRDRLFKTNKTAIALHKEQNRDRISPPQRTRPRSHFITAKNKTAITLFKNK
jgi:hypothetical protein